MIRGGLRGPGDRLQVGRHKRQASAVLGEVAGGEGPTSKGKKGKDEQGKLGVGRQAPAQTVEKVPEAGAGGVRHSLPPH